MIIGYALVKNLRSTSEVLHIPPFNVEDWGYSRVKDDGVPFGRTRLPNSRGRWPRLPAALRSAQAGAQDLDAAIHKNLEALGYGG